MVRAGGERTGHSRTRHGRSGGPSTGGALVVRTIAADLNRPRAEQRKTEVRKLGRKLAIGLRRGEQFAESGNFGCVVIPLEARIAVLG